MTNPVRKQISIEHDIRWNFDCKKFSEIIKECEYLMEKYGDQEVDISDFEEDGSPSCSIVFHTYRDETDAEVNKRLEYEQMHADHRRRQYEQLKKEFEK